MFRKISVIFSFNMKMNINFTPEVWTGRQLNEKTPSSRWVGATITGSMTRRRTNNWLKTKIKEYQATGATPELVIQGIMDDANSDYYAAHGSDVVTCPRDVVGGGLVVGVRAVPHLVVRVEEALHCLMCYSDDVFDHGIVAMPGGNTGGTQYRALSTSRTTRAVRMLSP